MSSQHPPDHPAAPGEPSKAEGQNGDPPPSRLRVDWLRLQGAPLIGTPGRVAMSALPQRPESDLAHLVRLGLSTIVTLVDDEEMARYGVTGLHAAVRAAGLIHLVHPMANGMPPPDHDAARRLCGRLLGLLGEGDNILLHCIGGLGRTGTIASALLIHEGHSAHAAIALVRRIRHPYCVETLAQETFLNGYAQMQQRYTRSYYFVPRALLEKGGLRGERGARRYALSGHEPIGPVPSAQLPRALALLHRRLSEEGMIVLSGELALDAPLPVPPASVPVDRAYCFDGQGLLPVRLNEVP